MRVIGGILLAAGLLCGIAGAAAAGTLDDVKARGVLRCGIAPNNPGFAYTDGQGVLRGFDVDLCHALAAAVLGDKAKIQLQVIEPRDAFTVLTAGTLDILTHRFTETFNRDNGIGIQFTVTMFYDGQGFMVRKSAGVAKLEQLNGATICVAQGTTTQLNIADYFKAHKLDYKIVTFNGVNESMQAYDEGRCDAWSNDRGSLASHQVTLKVPAEHIILPDTISKEPIGPVVRQNDPQWAHLVEWTWYALISAEELGITSANVDEVKTTSENPEAKRLLGVGDDLGQKLGLSADWAYQAVKQVGNYGEIFDNNLGEKSPLHLARGLNKQWREGGLIYAPPFR